MESGQGDVAAPWSAALILAFNSEGRRGPATAFVLFVVAALSVALATNMEVDLARRALVARAAAERRLHELLGEAPHRGCSNSAVRVHRRREVTVGATGGRMMKVLAIGAIFAGLTLTACATPYQEMGALGGVRAVRITQDTAQITASGNGYTDPDTIQRYALRRAAEETIADGFDFFRIVRDQDRTTAGSATYGSATGNRYGIWGWSFSEPIIKPGQSLMIKMTKGPPPNPRPDDLFDAHDVLAHLAGTPYGGDRRDCAPDASGRIVCK
ncbi:MAG TPA: hypothetical protein VG939_05370 [Caulobacteraceae bacterium]|nr:hypothetical protein [Caulobacteraceae bacterium]